MLGTRQIVLLGVALAGCAPACAIDKYPMKLAAPGGEVLLQDEWAKGLHDLGVAVVRRFGDTLYLGGLMVYRADGEGKDKEALKIQSRRTLGQFKSMLEASGASFQDVVMINSYHVWEGSNFDGSAGEQFDVFAQAVREFMKPPYATWAAVGTSGLLDPRGIIEVQLIARIPPK